MLCVSKSELIVCLLLEGWVKKKQLINVNNYFCFLKWSILIWKGYTSSPLNCELPLLLCTFVVYYQPDPLNCLCTTFP